MALSLGGIPVAFPLVSILHIWTPILVKDRPLWLWVQGWLHYGG